MTKYPAHSTEPSKPWNSQSATNPQNWQTAKPTVTVKKHHNETPVFIRYLFVGCLALLLGVTCVGSFYLDEYGQSEQNAPHVVAQYSTNTAEPSETPKPTHTSYPTFTHTATVEAGHVTADEKKDVIVFVTVEVTRIVERVITQTPAPATATLTPTRDLAPEYAAIALSAEKRANAYEWLLFIGVCLLAGTFCGVALVAAVISIRAQIMAKQPTLDDTEETAEEIVNRSPIPGVTRDELDQIRFMKAQNFSKAEMERVISNMRGKEYTGGTIHYHVSKVLDYLEQSTTPPPPDDVPQIGATQA